MRVGTVLERLTVVAPKVWSGMSGDSDESTTITVMLLVLLSSAIPDITVLARPLTFGVLVQVQYTVPGRKYSSRHTFTYCTYLFIFINIPVTVVNGMQLMSKT